jgi:flagellar protein FliS
MFRPATEFATNQRFAAAYRQIGAETAVADATPHRLVTMLFDGYADALAQARGALARGQTEQKGRAIARAVRIVGEGLRASLNLDDGGALAQDLHALYAYIETRLTMANLRNDDSMLEECQRLIQPLRDAWASIAERVPPVGVR